MMESILTERRRPLPGSLSSSGVTNQLGPLDILRMGPSAPTHQMKITSVSEMIRETAACRSPKCIRKTRNTFCVTWVSVPVPKFCENLVLTQNFTRTITWVMAKTDFQYGGRPPAWIFKIFIFWSHDCHEVPNLLLCTKFHQNRMIFRWDLTIFKRGHPPSWILGIQKWVLYRAHGAVCQ